MDDIIDAGRSIPPHLFKCNVNDKRHTSLVLEGLNTVIDYSGGGRNCGPNSAYAGQYGGYTNHGEVIGASVDTAGQSIGIDVLHDFGDYSIGWGVNQVFINDTNNPSHRLSRVRVEGQTGYLSYERAIGQGRIKAGLMGRARGTGSVCHDGFHFDGHIRVLLYTNVQI